MVLLLFDSFITFHTLIGHEYIQPQAGARQRAQKHPPIFISNAIYIMPIKSKKRNNKKNKTLKNRNKKGGNDENDDDCPICLGNEGGPTDYVTKCHHKFHKKCIEDWLKINNTCPMCRAEIPHVGPPVAASSPSTGSTPARRLNFDGEGPGGGARLGGGVRRVCGGDEHRRRANHLRNAALLYLGATASQLRRLEPGNRRRRGGSSRRTRKKSHNRKTK